jgi:peroxiredoxin
MGPLPAGKKAPAFELKGEDGSPRTFKAQAGEPLTLLAFYKDTCPVCQFTLPFLESIYQGVKGKLSFWAVSQDDAQKAKGFARDYRLSFPQAIDKPGYPVSNAYGIRSVPTTFLIEPGGKILKVIEGFVKNDLEDLAKDLGKLLRVPVPSVFKPGDDAPALRPG